MKKHFSLKVQFLQHRWPIIAIGFIGGGNEFMVSLWLIDVRIAWGY